MTHHEEFYLRHLDRAGNVQALAVTSFLRLRYRKVASETGVMSFDFLSTDPLVADIERHDWFEVYRRHPDWDLPWHLAFKGMVLGFTYAMDENGIVIASFDCRSNMVILDWRQVSYPSGIDNRSKFSDVPAETLFKTVVDYNFTALATTANQRLRDGDMLPGMGYNITTAPDLGRGEIVSHSFGNGNAGRVFRDDIQPVANGDIDLVETAANTFAFEFYPGQLGDDKTTGQNAVIFSTAKNNMVNMVQYLSNGVEERTVAIVGGQGNASERAYAIVEGQDFAPDNDKEYYVDARHEGTANSLPNDGERRLVELESYCQIEFEVVQTPTIYYSEVAVFGKQTYRVGDLVHVVGLCGNEFNMKIKAVEVIVYPREPSPTTLINVELDNVRY